MSALLKHRKIQRTGHGSERPRFSFGEVSEHRRTKEGNGIDNSRFDTVFFKL